MSQLFSFSRFQRLFGKHTAEQMSSYLLATGVLVLLGVVLGLMAYFSPWPVMPDTQSVVFVMGLLGAGSFFTSTVFVPYGEKKQATAALMLPASHWEKFLVGWLYSVPIFLVVYVVCFYVIDVLVVNLDDWHGQTPQVVSLFSGEHKLYIWLIVYVVVNALFLWGSIFFAKQHFVRTAFGLLLGAVVLVVANFQAVQALVGRSMNTVMPFASMTFQEDKEWYTLSLPPAQSGWLLLVPLGVMLLGWAAAYTRLTEKQI
jgi:hypothetical protein